MDDKIYCPHCKGTERTTIDVSEPSGYTCMITRECGKVNLLVCLNCGTVYLDRHYLEGIRERKLTKARRFR